MSSNENPKPSGPLADLKGRGDGFRTPLPAFFDRLADEAITAGQQTATVRSLWPRLQYVALGVFLLLLVSFLLQGTFADVGNGHTTETKPSAAELLAKLKPDDIKNYLEDYPAADLEAEIFPADYPETDDDE
jgi:hypothetical protein